MENDASDVTTRENTETTIPSCESCRKRKLRCPRQQPVCSNCEKFDVDCVYDYERKKPGLKVGAVESLSRRLDAVEKTLSVLQENQHNERKGSLTEPHSNVPISTDAQLEDSTPVIEALAALTKGLHHLTSAVSSSASFAPHKRDDGHHQDSSRKRRRCDGTLNEAIDAGIGNTTSVATVSNDGAPLSEFCIDSVFDQLVDAYFHYIHPWISIIHEPSFRQDIQSNIHKERLEPVVHGIIVAALRFVRDGGKFLPEDVVAEQMLKARRSLIFLATGDVRIENAQALLILAYTDVADDNLQSTLSLMGIVNNHVKYLQLNLEQLKHNEYSGVFGKHGIQSVSNEWIDEEERRRVFWNAFMLDRLSSALVECSPLLPGATIDRRLPACASFWYTNQRHATPYLRVSDSSTAALGHAIAAQQPLGEPGTSENCTRPAEEEVFASRGIGSLAFYVQTVESMSMVISHFLRCAVDFNSRNDVSRWLTTFRELDLHLIRWRRNLPQQWVDSGISRNIMPGIMDASMTAANAIHNTALILLHEKVAYPNAKLAWIQLPSQYSAKTCQQAASEICRTIKKFLEQNHSPFPLSPQLGLCAFVSARSLLRHWRFYDTPLAAEFWLFIQALDDMANRWKSQTEDIHQLRPTSCFSRFASRLRNMHAQCEIDPTYQIDDAEGLYEHIFMDQRASARHWVSRDTLVAHLQKARMEKAPMTLQGKGLPLVSYDDSLASDIDIPRQHNQTLDSQMNMEWGGLDVVDQAETRLEDETLLQLSQALMDPDFTAMDRIFSFDDMMLSGL